MKLRQILIDLSVHLFKQAQLLIINTLTKFNPHSLQLRIEF